MATRIETRFWLSIFIFKKLDDICFCVQYQQFNESYCNPKFAGDSYSKQAPSSWMIWGIWHSVDIFCVPTISVICILQHPFYFSCRFSFWPSLKFESSSFNKLPSLLHILLKPIDTATLLEWKHFTVGVPSYFLMTVEILIQFCTLSQFFSALRK